MINQIPKVRYISYNVVKDWKDGVLSVLLGAKQAEWVKKWATVIASSKKLRTYVVIILIFKCNQLWTSSPHRKPSNEQFDSIYKYSLRVFKYISHQHSRYFSHEWKTFIKTHLKHIWQTDIPFFMYKLVRGFNTLINFSLLTGNRLALLTGTIRQCKIITSLSMSFN